MLVISFLFLLLNFQQETPARVSEPIHVNTLRGFDQLEPYLHRKSDSIYIVNFWATWCTPCRKEMPAFDMIQKQYANKKVKVLLVSLDLPNQLETSLVPFIRKNKLSPEIVLLDDPHQNLWIDKVDAKWSGALPFTLIYGRNFRTSYERTFHYNELDSIINLKLNIP